MSDPFLSSALRPLAWVGSIQRILQLLQPTRRARRRQAESWTWGERVQRNCSNRRRSAIVVAVFFLGLGWNRCRRRIAHPGSPSFRSGQSASSTLVATMTISTWTPVFIGVAVCAVLAILGIAYSLTAGARLVLRTSGAVPINPTQYPQVLNLVSALAIGEGIPTPSIYVIEDPSPNAFATGISPDRAALTFTTGLLAIMNREELEGVISHEMSHIKNHDIRLLLVVGTLIGLAVLLSSLLWRTAFWGSFGEGDEGSGNQLLLVLWPRPHFWRLSGLSSAHLSAWHCHAVVRRSRM